MTTLITSENPVEIAMTRAIFQKEEAELGDDVKLKIFQLAAINYGHLNKYWNGRYKHQQTRIAKHLRSQHVTRVIFPQIVSSKGSLEDLDKKIKQLYRALNESAKYERMELLYRGIAKGTHLPRFKNYLSDLASMILALPNDNREADRRHFGRKLWLDIAINMGGIVISAVLVSEGTDPSLSLLPLGGCLFGTRFAISDYYHWRAAHTLSGTVSLQVGRPFPEIRDGLAVFSQRAPLDQIIIEIE